MLLPFILLASAPLRVLGADILKTNGFSICQDDSDIKVERLNLEFDRSTKKIVFDVAGSSAKEQKVMATIIVKAYGKEVYRNKFNPCEGENQVDQLCPVPAGNFAAKGTQSIPESYISQIPGIAFNIPDLDGQATLQLQAVDGGEQLACIMSTVNNGKSMNVPSVSYVAAGIAGAALAVSGLSALAGAQAGAGSHAPTFIDVMTWFQSMAMNGMMSVQYPGIYQSFTKNFAFSGGLIYWEGMQNSIDKFRNNTGGNLTENSVSFLKNATLIRADPGSTNLTRRGLANLLLFARDELETQVNGTAANSTASDGKLMHEVEGIQAYVEQLMIPDGNTFMTVLMIFAIIIAAITVGILLFKVILETWALFGSFPRRLTGFRKRYWWLLAKTITNLILLLYGIWTLYCVYQFKNGDSWAAKVLAGVTLGIFTAILLFFTWKIYAIAHQYKKLDGNSSALYDDKTVWRKYNIFYENYKKSYWWLFMPLVVYMFVKGCIIAGADGHGLIQSAGQLIVEALLLLLLIWSRPFSLKSSNWINIVIQVVRVLSVVCILVFVEELGVTQTTKTVTGLVLVVMQSVLTGLLAILIAVNAIIICCRDNPHRKKRKEAEKARDLDNLTPLDARNSLLMDPTEYKRASGIPAPFVSRSGYDRVPVSEQQTGYTGYRGDVGAAPLLSDAASFDGRGHSPADMNRAPRLPSIDLGAPPQQPGGYQGGYRGHAY